MDRIPFTEVVFHPLSFGDPNGRVFWWNGELYRAITSGRAPLYRDLFANGVVRELFENRLIVDSEVTDFFLEGYDLVLKHRKVPFVSYAFEWCGPMLKDAALRGEVVNHG
jgi:hypothetical protein